MCVCRVGVCVCVCGGGGGERTFSIISVYQIYTKPIA